MSLELDKVHHYVRQPGTQDVKLIQTNPYVRFSVEGHPVVFLQKGRFWYENGVQVTEIERWLAQAIELANPKALKEAGYEEDLGFEDSEEPLQGLATGDLPPTAGKSAARNVPRRETSGDNEPDEPPVRRAKPVARPVAAKAPAKQPGPPPRRVPGPRR